MFLFLNMSNLRVFAAECSPKDLNVEVRADDRNLGVQNAELNATSAKEVVDAKYSTLNMEAVTVTVNNTDANNRTVKVTPKEGDNTYKGSVTLTYTVKKRP
ncbi:MAG: hypothetical protein U9532_01300 ['Conium maculatum' witches'-broom phytoplasma]|nr:hypothetical protein ['Conium maculatum' witches'-broom phytoplasma]